MLPQLPVISKIFIENNDLNKFQHSNIDNIIKNIKIFNKNQDLKIEYIDKNSLDNIIKNESNDEEEYNLISINKIHEELPNSKNNYHKNKNTYNLIIQKNPGNYIKKCPGTPNYICCNYFITTFYINCNLNCTYCFLKFYLKDNNITIYCDIDNFLLQLNNFQKLRLGSGELSDSLLFDPFTNYSDIVMDYLSKNPLITFEFKTKTTYIEPFLARKPINNVVIGFSLNPEKISSQFETLAASIDERSKAAEKLIDKGWKVSFHFDPIILIDESTENDYLELFDKILKLPFHSIAWCSLGTLRYHPDMMNNLRLDEKGTILLKKETIKGMDGKIRYFIDDRIRIYKKLINLYKEKKGKFPLYFCMESDKVYLNTFGCLPNKIDKLNDIFNLS